MMLDQHIPVKTHPGPQVKIWSFNKIMLILSVLLGLSLLFLIYSVFQENLGNLKDNVQPYFRNKLLDSKAASTLFVTLLGFILVRHHFLVSLRPRIIYETRKVKKSAFDHSEYDGIIWQVRIKNNGLGAAILSSYKFRLSFDEIVESEYDLTHAEIVSLFEQKDIHLENDYCLLNLTNGYTIPSKEDIVIFEIKVPVALNIKQFDLFIEFNGFVAGKFMKEVYLLPRLGIPKAAISQSKG